MRVLESHWLTKLWTTMMCCQASLCILIGGESWCSSTPKNLQQQINLQISVNGQGLKLTNFILVNKFKKAIPQCVWQCSIEPCQLSSLMSALDGFHHFVSSFVARNPNGQSFSLIFKSKVSFWTTEVCNFKNYAKWVISGYFWQSKCHKRYLGTSRISPEYKCQHVL